MMITDFLEHWIRSGFEKWAGENRQGRSTFESVDEHSTLGLWTGKPPQADFEIRQLVGSVLLDHLVTHLLLPLQVLRRSLPRIFGWRRRNVGNRARPKMLFVVYGAV
jgi:hypothetical protein